MSAESLKGRKSGVQTAGSKWAAGILCERGDIGLERDLEGEMESEQRELGVMTIPGDCVSKKQPV